MYTTTTKTTTTTTTTTQVSGRTHPVTLHHARATALELWEEEVLKTCARAHRSLPAGGMLVFMTGRRDVERLVSELRRRFSPRALDERRKKRARRRRGRRGQADGGEDAEEEEDMEAGKGQGEGEDKEEEEELEGKGKEEEEGDDDEEAADESAGPAHIVPLYSMLPPREQMKAFEPPPPGQRLVVVATNVAETSITIPGIKYVVDSGREKRRVFDQVRDFHPCFL